MMMLMMWILSAIVTWTTPPPPIQGFDRWDPAALFRIAEVFGNRQVDEGPNRDLLAVQKTGSVESRSLLEFDLEALPEEFDLITLNILIGNADPGPPVEVVEFFHYAGDGERDIEDWDAGEYFWTHDNPPPQRGWKVPNQARRHRVGTDVSGSGAEVFGISNVCPRVRAVHHWKDGSNKRP